GVGAVDQVDANRLDGCAGQGGQRFAGVAEVGGDVDRGPLLQRSQRGVDPLGQCGRVGGDVGDQRGLVNLHPLHAFVGELSQQVGVQRNQLVESLDGCARTVDCLAQ